MIFKFIQVVLHIYSSLSLYLLLLLLILILLRTIQLYGHTTFRFIRLPTERYLSYFQSGAIINRAAINIHMQFCVCV